jgi:photosystem II stability/assembly factor-like uncharacterized protein
LIGDPVDAKPYLLETNDGGQNWVRMDPDRFPGLIPGEYAFAASGTSLDACPDGTCYFVTGGSVARIFRSPDWGKTWTVQALPALQGDPAAGAFSVAAGPNGRIAVSGGNYQKMKVSGSNIMLSGDKGSTWEVPSGAGQVSFMECVHWLPDGSLVACGPPGVWISSDYGLNWREGSVMGFHALDVEPRGRQVWLAGDKGRVATFYIEKQ